MKKVFCLIKTVRLRTLPLSVSGVSLGLMLAAADYHIRWYVALSVLMTAVFLQILSNVSNELGDTLKGTDRADRKGPSYPLSSGKLSIRDLKMMIWGAAVLSAVSGLSMIWLSFGSFLCLESILLIVLGAVSISGAMRYTLGSRPYGYKGLGDMSVIVFFGLVAVSGSYFVAAHEFRSWIILLPSLSAGTLSAGVLNVNNMRDMDTDAATRVTIPLRLGLKGARIYHTILITIGWASMTAYSLLRFFDPWHFLFFVTLPLFVVHLCGVWRLEGKALDRMLPMFSISVLLFALTAGAGFLVYLL